MSARDAARFGLLFARNGMWEDERILSEHWVRRSTALYSIDSEVMGYGFMWWVFLDDRFEKYGAYSALGVGNQMIAVFPKLDMVIVNRANTYQGEGTPAPALADLLAMVLDARVGAPQGDANLEPLEVAADPLATSAAPESLRPFVGEWDYPPAPLGLPAATSVELTEGEGHLVAYSPLSGTFKLYLQADGSLHEEDSRRRYVPVRDASGQLAGISDVGSLLNASVLAAAAGRGDDAALLLSQAQGTDEVQAGVARAVVDLLEGRAEAAEASVRDLAAGAEPAPVEMQVNAAGYVLLQSEQAEAAVEVFELNTRVFPDAFNTWDSLGEGAAELGRFEEAIRYYERSLELNPDNTNAVEMIGRIREAQGQ
jgi:tetratricopeptide (TPR) repeat protein